MMIRSIRLLPRLVGFLLPSFHVLFVGLAHARTPFGAARAVMRSVVRRAGVDVFLPRDDLPSTIIAAGRKGSRAVNRMAKSSPPPNCQPGKRRDFRYRRNICPSHATSVFSGAFVRSRRRRFASGRIRAELEMETPMWTCWRSFPLSRVERGCDARFAVPRCAMIFTAPREAQTRGAKSAEVKRLK